MVGSVNSFTGHDPVVVSQVALQPGLPISVATAHKKPFYASLSFQVLLAILLAILLGHFSPARAVALKPLGDAFIRLITMIITLVIFCTVVTGIAGMEDMKKVGRVGGKALLYFETVSTVALLIGLIVGNVVQPGSGWNIDAKTLDSKAIADYAGPAKAQSVSEFILHIIPTTVTDAFAKGDILQVLFISILFGFALSMAGTHGKPLLDLFVALTQAVFGIVKILMRFAPIGAFGAMAFTVGKYGIAALGPLLKLIGLFYLTSILFVIVVLGVIARLAGFGIFKFLHYIKEEILIVIGVTSSEAALPTLMEKMERLGCSKGLVGLVLPTGYTFNTDGTSIYMTLAALFGRQRSAGRFVYRAGGHAHGGSDNSSSRDGIAAGHRSLHEHGARAGQYDRQRGCYRGGVSLGKRN